MACKFVTEATQYVGREFITKSLKRLKGKTWRSHNAACLDLNIGESMYVQETAGQLSGFYRQITRISKTEFSVSRPLMEF